MFIKKLYDNILFSSCQRSDFLCSFLPIYINMYVYIYIYIYIYICMYKLLISQLDSDLTGTVKNECWTQSNAVQKCFIGFIAVVVFAI